MPCTSSVGKPASGITLPSTTPPNPPAGSVGIVVCLTYETGGRGRKTCLTPDDIRLTGTGPPWAYLPSLEGYPKPCGETDLAGVSPDANRGEPVSLGANRGEPASPA